MMWTAPSIDKFDKLKKEVEERKKNAETEIQQRKENLEREIQELKKKVEREIKQLRKNLEWEIEELHALEKLKINSETAIQLFESGVDDFEKKRISMANSDSEPKKKKEKRLKLTDSLIPFSNKVQNGICKGGDSRNVGEFSGIKEGGDTHNSGVDKAKPENQTKKTRAGGRGPACLISRRCDLKIIKIIKDNLQRENLERFQQSCFGRFLEIKELEFQGQLYLHLLLNMDMAASNKEKLVFKINNSSMEFGPREFFQITGLRIGTLDRTIKTPSSSSIHKKMFKGRPTIVMKDIEKAFLCHKGEGELKLKLALLCFLYGTLLAGNANKRIDLEYLHLIDDLQNFNAFPWGRVAYEFLVSFMLSTRVLMDKDRSKNLKPSLFIYGFSVALQVWAYEVIPSLAEFCAVRVSDSENLTPGILRWSTKRMVVRFGELKIFFTPGDEAHLEDVTRDTIRRKMLIDQKDVYNLDSDDDDDGDDVRSMQTNKRKRRSKSTAAASDPQPTDSNDCSTNFMDNYISKA